MVLIFKKFVLKNPYQMFLTILLPFLLSTVLLLLVQSSFLSSYFEDYVLQLVYNQQKSDLANTSRNVNTIAKSAKSLAVTAFFDSDIKGMLYSNPDVSNYGVYEDKLQSYKFIYPFLQSMYIYNKDHIYASPSTDFANDRGSFPDQGIFKILDDTKNNKPNSMVLRKIPNILSGIATSAEPYVSVYSYLFFDSPVSNGKASEAIILNISEQSIDESISSSEVKDGNRIFIVNQDGKLFSKDGQHPLLTDLREEPYMQAITSSKEKTGNFRMDVKGVDSFITYTATDEFNWKLISITPYEVIVKDIEAKKQRTYLFVIGFIVGSILLSLYFARRLYSPVKLVIQNYNLLELEKKNEFYSKKQVFLRRFIRSDYQVDLESVERFMGKYRITLDAQGAFRMILIKIDGYSEFCAKYSLSDRQLIKFGLNNIVSEMLTPACNHECVDMEEDQMLVLMNCTPVEVPDDPSLVALIQDIQLNLEKYLSISVSIAYSAPFESLSNVNFHYLKTLDLSYYRFILGRRSIISHHSVSIKPNEYKYPHNLDKRMTDALLRGQTDEAKGLLTEIVQQASDYSYTTLNSVLIQLLISIRYAIEVVETNQSIKLNFNFNQYFAKLQKIETLEQVLSDLYELLEQLGKELEAKKDNKYTKLIEDVIAIIHQDFANPALSLDTIAEKVDLHPEYVRKLFKKHHPIAVNELINQVRLTHASERIAHSSDSIIDIMEQSGFISRSHFFSLFKKAYGITPNQYRSNAKAREA